MKWGPQKQGVVDRDLPKIQPEFLIFQCIYGPHKAEVLHRGTAYCRSCYDEKSRVAKLIDY